MNPEAIILDQQQQTDNGGANTSYYQLDPSWKEVQDIIEAKQYNYAEGNILKVAFTLNSGRHSGTSRARDLRKLIYFTNRLLQQEQP